MKYYIIAGEASGDLHGSNLIRALLREDAEAQVRCWGGDRMERAGGTLVKHYRELSFMGFLEVLTHLPAIFRNLAYCKKDIEAFAPDALIFIDFSGFNLRIAKWAHARGIRTHYYIAPQVWASREGRVAAIKRDIDALYAILPFEVPFYKRHGMPAHFVGHPLLDALNGATPPEASVFRKENGLDPEKPIIALLPGSRKQEIQKILSVMLEVVPHYPQYQFVIAGAPNLGSEQYAAFGIETAGVPLLMDQTYPLLQHATAALVTSGTATLETALLGVPQVVCYKGSWISYQIARRLITLKYISLVNLIMDREVVRELIQGNLHPGSLREELDRILSPQGKQDQLSAYQELRQRLGGAGASGKAAKLIVNFSRS